jgi:hypothetical protein
MSGTGSRPCDWDTGSISVADRRAARSPLPSAAADPSDKDDQMMSTEFGVEIGFQWGISAVDR